ncbi:MAG: DUF4256 domain-containing protein [Gemmatimonadaceae bacterium]|nr:DUF4256 domain-containing protein [Gemmatimonadaceae bacterium]
MKAADQKALIQTLKDRFEQHSSRHSGIKWSEVQAKLAASPRTLDALHEMERTGGEPDVIGYDKKSKSFIFCDCSPESPAGRRSLCFDGDALAARKANKPSGSAMEMAASLGIEILTEAQYRELQELGEFDAKTSSWVMTPSGIRELGGALFCDRRFGQVFVYHNGAESYYAARGFRGRVSV